MYVSTLISWPVSCLQFIFMVLLFLTSNYSVSFYYFRPSQPNWRSSLFLVFSESIHLFIILLVVSLFLVLHLLPLGFSQKTEPAMWASLMWACLQKVHTGVKRVSKEGENILSTAVGNLGFIWLILVDKWIETL